MEKVYAYRLGSVVVMTLFSPVLAAGWVAFVYLALPKAWEWGTDGLIPYSQSSMAPWEDVLAWGMAGIWVVLGVVGLLVRVFGVREVVLSDKGVVFRGRAGQEKAVISRVTAVTALKRKGKGVRIEGSSPQWNKMRRIVREGLLGKKEYQDFQEELHRLFSVRDESS